MNYLYIPSTAEGKTWRAYVYKPQGRQPYASAIEGELGEHSFTTIVGIGDPSKSSRNFKVPLEGSRATDKAKRAALLNLVVTLQSGDYITPEAAAEAAETIRTADRWEA